MTMVRKQHRVPAVMPLAWVITALGTSVFADTLAANDFSFPPPATSAVPVTNLAGTVRAVGGAPIGGARVTARHLTRPVTVGTLTDEQGRFHLAGLIPGSYRVEARHRSYGPAARDSVPAGAVNGVVDLTLPGLSGPTARASSAEWLALLPDGEMKRRFVLDCTGCHRFDESRALVSGVPRSRERWAEDVRRMVGFAGARSSFPVISSFQDTATTAAWLAQHVTAGLAAAPGAGALTVLEAAGAMVTEYDVPVPGDLPHDVAVDSGGQILVTGMFSHVMLTLDPATGDFTRHEIPVPNSNPRAVELDGAGNWWVLLGQPGKVARFEPARIRWTTYDIGMYPHSIAVAPGGAVWFNGHFTRDPELIGKVDAVSGQVTTFHLPAHPTLAQDPGGPIPYEQRVAPDGRVWVSELQGNRMVAFDPSNGRSEAHVLPTSHSGPRRFDIDRAGILWIPAYGANLLVRFDPATGRFTEHQIPVPDATPYVARIDHGTGLIWIGMAASDHLASFDPRTERFTFYPLPSHGALIRHLAIDPRTHEVWAAYGASPGRIPAKIARLRLTP